LHDLHAQHQSEVGELKKTYDEIFHRLETDLEAKKELSNELQNQVNVLQVLLQQEQAERGKAESELERVRQREEQLNDKGRTMEAEFREALKRIEELTREFEKTEGKLVELQIKYNKVKSDKHHAEKAADKSRKELKKLS
jgi:chromosome segregation ATPase